MFQIPIIISLTLISNIKSQITILSPKSFVEKSKKMRIISEVGNFGEIPYGKTIYGYITINKQTDGTNYWCDISKATEIENKNEEKISDYVPIVLVDHSTNCKYAEKAYNVQSKGGRAMLLAFDSNNINEEYNVDDLIGEKVEIPTMIIGKDFANLIKEYYRENEDNDFYENITISIKFSGVKKDGNVKFDLFYRSDDIRTLNFFKEFEWFKNKIEDKLIFTPRLKYNNYINEHSTNELNANSKFPCIKDFHYCTTPNFNIGINNPREILLENLRQSCIFESFDLNTFWNYMIKFTNDCADLNKLDFTETCSLNVIKNLKIDEEQLNDCLNNLVEGEGKIEDDYEYYKKKRIFSTPEIILNGVKYKGSFSAKQIFSSICNAFIDDEEGKCNMAIQEWKNRDSNFASRLILTIILIIVCLLIFSYLCYRRMVKIGLDNAINEKIQEQAMKAISQYKAFQEGKGNDGNVLGTVHKLELVND